MDLALSSLIFIDGGDPKETLKADEQLKLAGYSGIGGQTTNPTLVSKNPEVMKYLISGKKLTQDEALAEYKKIVESVAKVTSGPVSIQVIGDLTTSSEEFLRQARIYRDWIPNGVVKFPCTANGLAAAEIFCGEWSVNITLNFSQEQAAAVYVATRNAKHRVFISPFVGRLDDRGENGMDVVSNTLKMYQTANQHVSVLTASVRRLDHIFYALSLKSPAITIPFKTFQMWSETGFRTPLPSYRYDPGALTPLPYKELTLDKDWHDYDLHHDLTDAGVTKFMEDWTNLIR
ncbi:MAG: transaldolase family protein [Patescibacteria group bacterium]